MMRHKLFLKLFLVAILPLAGCGGRAEIKIPEVIYIDRPVPCLPPDGGPKPPEVRTEAQLLALDRYRRTHAVWAERLRLSAYAGEADAALRGSVSV